MLSESQKISGKQIALHRSIFHWREGAPNHCLLRIYEEQVWHQVVVVMSSLASNKGNKENIGLDVKALLSGIIRNYGEYLGEDPNQVAWLFHFGLFSRPKSYATPYSPETFVLTSFEWEGNRPLKRASEEVLTPFQLQPLIPWLDLTPVEDELNTLRGS